MNSIKAKLESICGVQRIEGLHPYRGVYLIHNPSRAGSETETWVLKQLKVGAGKAYLIGKLLSNASLRSLTPNLIQPDTRSYYLWIGGNRYQLTQYLEGLSADYYHINDLHAAIGSMAVFHRYTIQLLIGNQPKSWALIKYDLFREWQKRLSELEMCRVIAIRAFDAETIQPEARDFIKKYLQHWPECYDQALQAFREINNPDYLFHEPQPICYHDWAHHNLIIHQGTACLIDFDYMLIDHPVHDRANLAGHYLRLHQWSFHSLNTLLESFSKGYPFKSGELNLLHILLLFPYDFWILGRQYFLEKQPWSLKYYQNQWDRKINLYQQRNRLLAEMERLI